MFAIASRSQSQHLVRGKDAQGCTEPALLSSQRTFWTGCIVQKRRQREAEVRVQAEGYTGL